MAKDSDLNSAYERCSYWSLSLVSGLGFIYVAREFSEKELLQYVITEDGSGTTTSFPVDATTTRISTSRLNHVYQSGC